MKRWPILVFALCQCASSAPAQPAIFQGAAWYPEQWPQKAWQRDLELMSAAGVRMVRIGEFAWSSIEPREGEFTLDWMERAVEMAAKHSIVTVIGTPSDAPPAWLTQRYPETLRVNENGERLKHGGRRQFSYTSPKYRELCRRVVEEMAKRLGRNRNVIGWQIGNEFTDDSYDEHSHQLFQGWLERKFKTLDALNEHWATAYWSQTYSSWDQIPMPDSRSNPGLQLEYKRFVTDQWRSFQRVQLDAIRAHASKEQFITTNLGGLGWANRFNRYEFVKDLDFITWDNYVGQGHLEPYRNGATHDLVRGWKMRNFWVMEIQPGFVNWAPVSNILNKGETRRMIWQAVGHGADCIAYWQWRSALNGQEQYHGTVVGADGEPVPFYEEVKQIGAEFAAATTALAGTSPVSEVAILHDYDSRWAIDFQPHNRNYDQIAVLLDYYRPLRDQAQSVDIVAPEQKLETYKVVVAPSLNVISDDRGRRLLRYVQAGGHLVLGPRSGMKDEFNSLRIERQPGPLVAPLGGRVEQFYALIDDAPVTGDWGDGKVKLWAEQLSVKGRQAAVLMRFGVSNGWLDGQPAVITNQVGKGRLTYIGGVLDSALMGKAVRWMLASAGVRPAFGPLPEGVEACRRVSGNRRVFVLLNHGEKAVHVALPRAMRDVLANRAGVTSVELPVGGVSVLGVE